MENIKVAPKYINSSESIFQSTTLVLSYDHRKSDGAFYSKPSPYGLVIVAWSQHPKTPNG